MVNLPDLVLPKQKYFGLSIGITSVRAVELDKRGLVRAVSEVVFPEEVFKDGMLSAPDTLAQALKTLVNTGKFSSPYVAVCFPEAFAFSRGYTLPKIPMEEVGEAISWHAKDLFPFPSEDIYFDWKILETKEKEYVLSVVAVQKKLLDPLVSTLIASGLKPLRFEPDASAIARLLLLKSDHYVLVTEVNKKNAYVTLVQGEKALFSTVVTHVPEEPVGTYVQNIKLTLDEIAAYYKTKGVLHEDKPEVILTGDVASEDWIHHIPYPTKILRTVAQNPAFNKAYAAAVAKIVPPSDPQSINLLPASMQLFYDTERNTQYYRTILVRLNILILGVTILAFFSYFALMLERQRLDTQVKRLTALNASSTANTRGLLLLNAQSKNIVMLAPLRVTPKDKLDAILQSVLDGVTLSQIAYDDQKLQFTVDGVAQTRDTLLAFQANLDGTKQFSKITVPLEALATPKNIKFSLTFITK